MPVNLLKRIAFALVAVCFAGTFFILGKRLVGQAYFHQARNAMLEVRYEEAINGYKKGLQLVPADAKSWMLLGEVLYSQARVKPYPVAFPLYEQSKQACLKAVDLNPHEARNWFRLARAEAGLQKLFPLVSDSWQNPYDADPYFEKAVARFPHAGHYYLWYARHLGEQYRFNRLLEIVEMVAASDPAAFGRMRKEPYWSPAVERAVQQGLEKAVALGVNPDVAHRNLSGIHFANHRYAPAVEHYSTGLKLMTAQRAPGHLRHLGRLYLRNRQLDLAADSFENALMQARMDGTEFERVYHTYRREKLQPEFVLFCEALRGKTRFSKDMELVFARALLETDATERSEEILKGINASGDNAGAYSLLARIAGMRKDWDAMELAAQRATVLDKENAAYHYQFARSLSRQKRFVVAEGQMDLAILYAVKPSPWYHNSRAHIRLHLQNYYGALEDWEAAISLKPDQASFYHMAAHVCSKRGDFDKALEYARKAVQLDPKNENYRRNLQRLKG